MRVSNKRVKAAKRDIWKALYAGAGMVQKSADELREETGWDEGIIREALGELLNEGWISFIDGKYEQLLVY